MGKRRYEKIDWSGCPPIEECTNMGDTNGNKMDIEVKETEGRPIPFEKEEKILRKENKIP